MSAVKAEHSTSLAKGESEETAAPVLDETAYYRDLRAALVGAQQVEAAAVEALGPARAAAIRNALVSEHGIAAARVQLLDAAAVEDPSGDEWVRCRLDVAAE